MNSPTLIDNLGLIRQCKTKVINQSQVELTLGSTSRFAKSEPKLYQLSPNGRGTNCADGRSSLPAFRATLRWHARSFYP